MSVWNPICKDGGIYLEKEDLWIDARRPKKQAIVSHAHSDHIANHQEIWATPETLAFLKVRIKRKHVGHPCLYGSTIELSHGISMEMRPSGHITGSALVSLVKKGERLLYTGDFKTRHSWLTPPCNPIQADVLIMETTYGKPEYVFPESTGVVSQIVQFCKGTLEDGDVPVLFVYSLGKAQEILKILGNHGLPVSIHPTIAQMTRPFESLGIELPPYEILDAKPPEGRLILCPPSAQFSTALCKIAHKRTAAISGWAMQTGSAHRFRTDETFVLSDHADYNELMDFVRKVNPRLIYTIHGFAHEFARDLRHGGYEAWALSSGNQIEFHFTRDTPTPPHVPLSSIPTESDSPGLFWDFCLCLESIEIGLGKKEKINLLSRFLSKVFHHDDSGQSLRLSALFACGRIFSIHDNTDTGITLHLYKRAIRRMCGLNPHELKIAHMKHKDLPVAVLVLLEGKTQRAGLSIEDLFDRFLLIAQSPNPADKQDQLIALLALLSPLEVKWASRIILGDLKAGIQEATVEGAISIAFDKDALDVRTAHILCGDIGEVALRAAHDSLHHVEMRCFRPIQFMLANSEVEPLAVVKDESDHWIIEPKYDGLRCQIHKMGGRVEIYARDLSRISDQLEDWCYNLSFHPEDFVLDGELISMRDGKSDPGLLSDLLKYGSDQLFSFSPITLRFFAFDCLMHRRQTCIRLPLEKRKEKLAQIAPHSLVQIAHFMKVAVWATDAGGFDLGSKTSTKNFFLKDMRSLYHPGRRSSSWLKFSCQSPLIPKTATACDVCSCETKAQSD